MELTLLNHQTWQVGRVLAFSGLDGPTDAERGLILQASSDGVGWDVRFPGEARIRFPSDTPHNFWSCSDAFRWESETGFVSCGVMIDRYHVLLKGYTSVAMETDALQFLCCNDMMLLGVAEHFRSEYIDLPIQGMMNQRLQWLDRVPEPKGLKHGDQVAFARACSQLKGLVSQTGKDGGRVTSPDRWPHREPRLPDLAFHLFGLRHIAPALARELLLTALQKQRKSGCLPRFFAADPPSQEPSAEDGKETEQVEGAEQTAAPMLRWAAWELYQVAKDREWLEEIYPLLASNMGWFLANRDGDGNGLPEWNIEADAEGKAIGSLESGMPGSPRFQHGLHLDAVDLSALLSKEFECMSFFAKELGRLEDQAFWRGSHFQLNAMMRQRLWNPATNFFHDFDIERKDWTPVMAVTGFMPLICGGASREQATHLVAHLENKKTFGTPLGVPTLARNQKGFEPSPWRGAVSVEMNWLVAEGLERAGFRKEARQLRVKTAGEMSRRLCGHGSLCAFYDPMCKKTNANAGSRAAEHGSSSSLFVDWMFRKVRSDDGDMYDTQS